MSTKWHFSTAEVPPRQRFAAWQAFVGEALPNLEVKVRDPDALNCKSHVNRFGVMSTSLNVLSDQEMSRRSSSADQDKFAFVFPLNGHFESLQRSRLISVEPGGAYCLHPAEGYRTTSAGNPSTLVVSAAFDRLRERVSWVEDCFGQGDFANPELVPLLQTFGRSLVHLDVSEDMTARLETSCLDLLTLLLEKKRYLLEDETIPWSMKETMGTNIDLFIRRNHTRPDLSAIDAAKELGVSERYIQKLMTERGTTFRQALIDHRLEEARRLLSSRLDLQVGQVARACGFVNQGHFATRYRKRFGNSPRDDVAGGA